ncbi:hypothetical protein V8C37DRAFT_317562 [Trichoderma ceciliae]
MKALGSSTPLTEEFQTCHGCPKAAFQARSATILHFSSTFFYTPLLDVAQEERGIGWLYRNRNGITTGKAKVTVAVDACLYLPPQKRWINLSGKNDEEEETTLSNIGALAQPDSFPVSSWDSITIQWKSSTFPRQNFETLVSW